MIDTTTYSTTWTYIQERRLDASFFWFVNIADHKYFTNGHTQYIDGSSNTWLPYNLVVTPIAHSANLFTGSVSQSRVQVDINNWPQPQTGNTTQRLSEVFSATREYISKWCKIYLGHYDSAGDVAELVPRFFGKIADIEYGINTMRFTVVDQAIFDLPTIPKNKFTRTDYDNIDEEFIDKPIPIVYGRHDWEQTHSTKYGENNLVPAYIIANNIDAATPEITLEVADHEVDAIRDLYIYDSGRRIYAKVLDTITNTLADAQTVLSLFDSNPNNFITTQNYLYPNRHTPQGAALGVTDPEKCYDGDFDTYTEIDPVGLNPASHILHMPIVEPFSGDDIFPDFSTTTGERTVGLDNVYIEFSAYPESTYSGAHTVTLSLENTTWTETFSNTTVNGWSDVDSFNVTSSNQLQIVNPRNFDGSTISFQIQESLGAAQNIVFSEGNYPTMAEAAQEADRKIEDNGSLANTYSVRYIKESNKLQITRETGTDTFRIHNGGYSADFGITAVSGYGTSYTSDTNTVLDVPDGDFSYIKIDFTITTGSPGLFVKGVRVAYERAFRSYNFIPFFTLQEARTILRDLPFQTTNLEDILRRNLLRGESVVINNRASVLDQVGSSRFFAAVDGHPTGATYFKKGPEIIRSILRDHIGIASAEVDSTAFSNANSDTQIDNLALYLAESSAPTQVFALLSRFSFGFVYVDHQGRYAMKCVKATYTDGTDEDFIVYWRDLATNLDRNFRITRNTVNEVATDLDFEYAFDWAAGKFDKLINTTVNTAANKKVDLQRKTIQSLVVNDADEAQSIAEYFCGDGTLDDFGQFGKPRVVINMTSLDPKYLFVELGDLVIFDTEFDTHLDSAFENTLSDLFFMVVGYNIAGPKTIRLTLLEVGIDSTPPS